MATVLIPIPDMDSTHRGRSQLASSHRPRARRRVRHRKRPAGCRRRHHGFRARPRCLVEGAGFGRSGRCRRFLRATRDARAAYAQMLESAEHPPHRLDRRRTRRRRRATASRRPPRARGMRSYIDSEVLQRLVVDAFRREMLVAAICHGMLLAARSVDPSTGRSVLDVAELTYDRPGR